MQSSRTKSESNYLFANTEAREAGGLKAISDFSCGRIPPLWLGIPVNPIVLLPFPLRFHILNPPPAEQGAVAVRLLRRVGPRPARQKEQTKSK
jgi:hypothetical protein